MSCAEAQELIVAQINAWDNEDCGTQPGDNKPNGQKCLYKVSYYIVTLSVLKYG